MKRLLSFVLLCGAHVACGQKGPPLAPIVLLPRQVAEVVVKRIENDIVLQFTVPTLNTDGSGPANLRRVEVYAHTGPLPKPEDFIKYGDLVASIEIKEPPVPVKADAEGAAGAAGATSATGAGAAGAEGATSATPDVAGATAPPATSSPSSADLQVGLIEQGWTTSVRETLTPKHREIGRMPPVRPPPPPDPDAPVVVIEKIETPGTVDFDLLPQRYYTMVGVSGRGKRGPFAGPIQVALLDPLTPPEKIDVVYTADTISLNWPAQPEDLAMTVPVGLNPGLTGLTGATGATGAMGATGATGAAASLAPGAPGAPNAPNAPIAPIAPVAPMVPADRETEDTVELFADLETDDTQDVLVAFAAPAKPTGVKPKPVQPLLPQPPPTARFGYNVYELGAMGATGATGAPIAPINAKLLSAPGFADPRVEFGVERCYVVRRAQMARPRDAPSAAPRGAAAQTASS